MEIKLNKSILTNWKLSYKEELIQEANNPNIARYLRDGFPHPYTEEAADFWLGMNQNVPVPHRFAITVDGKFAGGIGLELKEDVHRCNAELGYWLGEQYWGQGIVTEAIQAIVKYGFKTFEITRIFADVYDGNIGSRRALEKAGLKLEAIARKGIIKNNQILDKYVYSIIKPD